MRRGWSLAEVLIVITIVFASVALVGINLRGGVDMNPIDLQRAQFDRIDTALRSFQAAMRRYPSTAEGLNVLWSRDDLVDREEVAAWGGPYLDASHASDVWGEALFYRFPGEVRGAAWYDLVCAGPDGVVETDDDLSNHDDMAEAMDLE